MISYTMIIYSISRNSRVNRCINTSIIDIKALLTSLIFTISWLPFFIVFRVQRYPRTVELYNGVSMFLYINTVTDPCFYLIPNDKIYQVLDILKLTPKNSIWKSRRSRIVRNSAVTN